MTRQSRLLSMLIPSLSLVLFTVVFLTPPTHAIKFALQGSRYPPPKCIWNTAHPNSLVIVTANVGPGPNQRVDIEIVDSSPKKNVYLAKKNVKGEARLAITTHAEGEVGVCFRNYIEGGTYQPMCHPDSHSLSHSQTLIMSEHLSFRESLTWTWILVRTLWTTSMS